MLPTVYWVEPMAVEKASASSTGYSTAVEYYTRSTVIFDQLESILMLLAFLRKRKRVKLHVRLPHIAVFRFQKDTPASREFHSTTRLSYTYVPSLMGDDLSRRVCTCFLKLHLIPIVIVSMKYLKLQWSIAYTYVPIVIVSIKFLTPQKTGIQLYNA